MYKIRLFLPLLAFLLVGCAASKPKVDNTPLVQMTPTSTPTATPNLSEALPETSAVESFSSLPKNDLIDGFFYFDSVTAPSQIEFSSASSNSNKLRIRLTVSGDKACYLATGVSATDFEIESLVRERDGVWRGLHSKRYFTQPALNSLVIYGGETDKIGSYVNKLVKGDDVRNVTAQFAARATKVNNITRLTLPYNIEQIYRTICLEFEPIYFRGKLAKVERQSDIDKIEIEINEATVPSLSSGAASTPTAIPTP